MLENCAPTLSGACLACVGHIMVAHVANSRRRWQLHLHNRGLQVLALADAIDPQKQQKRSLHRRAVVDVAMVKALPSAVEDHDSPPAAVTCTTPPPAVPASRFHRTSTCSGCLSSVSREDPLQHQQRTVHMFLPLWCVVLSASCFRNALVVHSTCQHQQRTPHTFQSWSSSSRH